MPKNINKTNKTEANFKQQQVQIEKKKKKKTILIKPKIRISQLIAKILLKQ